jgi:hypothetical protein
MQKDNINNRVVFDAFQYTPHRIGYGLHTVYRISKSEVNIDKILTAKNG